MKAKVQKVQKTMRKRNQIIMRVQASNPRQVKGKKLIRRKMVKRVVILKKKRQIKKMKREKRTQ